MMTVFSGALKIERKPEIPLFAVGREFGIGFYAYLDKETAVKQAKRKAKRSFEFDKSQPIVNIYQLNLEDAKQALKVIVLNGDQESWLQFIMHCYTDIRFVHGYDIVIGNAVTSDTEMLLNQYRQNRLTKENLLKQLSCLPSDLQICCSTVNALSFLKYVDSEIVR